MKNDRPTNAATKRAKNDADKGSAISPELRERMKKIGDGALEIARKHGVGTGEAPSAAAGKSAKKAAKTATKSDAKPAAKAPKADKPEVTEGAKGGRPRTREVADSGAKFTVVDDSKVKRGFVREFVDAASKMGTFTRTDLVKKFAGKEDEARLVRYFFWCKQNGVFGEA